MHRVKWLLAVVALIGATTALAAPIPGGTQDPLLVPKFGEALVIPPKIAPQTLSFSAQVPVMDPVTGLQVTDPVTGLPVFTTQTVAYPNYYEMSVREFPQQVLPTFQGAGKPLKKPFPKTTVWGYGSVLNGAAFNYPAFTIEAMQVKATDPITASTVVLWKNELVDALGNYITHRLPIDPTLHWANPGGPVDTRPVFQGVTPQAYVGPVPIITHLHGGHIEPASDGFPEAWYLPAANNLAGWFTQGSNYGSSGLVKDALGNVVPAQAGSAYAVYRNDQKASTLWFHDHALGITRANVYMGLAGFYLLRDPYEVATLGGDYPYGTYEIPLAIQDRSFNIDGSLFYPNSRVFFDGFAGPYIPTTDVSPIWNPEFFGNHMVVNGKTWPKHTVQARKYRFRLLNGCDSRFLILAFKDVTLRNVLPIPFQVIGTEGGLRTGAPLPVNQLAIGPGERYDVIVDFSAVAPGTRVILANLGPDAPWDGFPVKAVAASDPATTGQVMAFDVVALPLGVPNPPLPVLSPPADGFEPVGAVSKTRNLTLTEIVTALKFGGPIEAQVGDGFGPLPWKDQITEQPVQGATEMWQIVNRTVDAHPIHLHQVQFEVVDRTPIDLAAYDAAIVACGCADPNAPTCNRANPPAGCPPDPFAFPVRGGVRALPNPWEVGSKDTVITRPGEITRVKAFFDIPGLYVWHCHILSHEDNEMMRPFCVTNAAVPACTK